MAFPTIAPTARSFDYGDWPVKKFKSQNGSEVRILYGDKRANMKLQLTYSNISDANAELFIDHYDEMKGSFTTFVLNPSAKNGWEGTAGAIGAQSQGNDYRYEGPPQVQQVRPGISTVTVSLIGVL